MIRSENARVSFLDANGQTLKLVNLYGSSADTKPTEGLVSGSTFVEVDTGKLFLFNEVASTWLEIGLGSGSNPNSVEVITGTADAPWGFTDYAQAFTELLDGLHSGNISATVAYDATAIGAGSGFNALVSQAGSDSIFLNGSAISSSAPLACDIQWNINGIAVAYLENNGTITNIIPYVSNILTTLTIYRHPMPEGE